MKHHLLSFCHIWLHNKGTEQLTAGLRWEEQTYFVHINTVSLRLYFWPLKCRGSAEISGNLFTFHFENDTYQVVLILTVTFWGLLKSDDCIIYQVDIFATPWETSWAEIWCCFMTFGALLISLCTTVTFALTIIESNFELLFFGCELYVAAAIYNISIYSAKACFNSIHKKSHGWDTCTFVFWED